MCVCALVIVILTPTVLEKSSTVFTRLVRDVITVQWMLVERSAVVLVAFAEPIGYLVNDRLDTDLRNRYQAAIVDVVVVRMAGRHDQLEEAGDEEDS